MADRIRSRDVARMTGFTIRAIQDMSKRGQIPGAAQLGSRWTYDEAKLRRWIREREDAACRTISTGAGKSGAVGSRFEGGTYDEAYERLLGR